MANGTYWHTGVGTPGADLGDEADLYLDQDIGRIYRKVRGTWVTEGILRAGARWYSGAGSPTAEFGEDGDMFLDISTGQAYGKRASTWVFLTDLRGPPGPPGPEGAQGDEAPAAPPICLSTSTPEEIEVAGGSVDTTLASLSIPADAPPVASYLITAKVSLFLRSNIDSVVSVACSLAHGTTQFDLSETTLLKTSSMGNVNTATVALQAIVLAGPGYRFDLLCGRPPSLPSEVVLARRTVITAMQVRIP